MSVQTLLSQMQTLLTEATSDMGQVGAKVNVATTGSGGGVTSIAAGTEYSQLLFLDRCGHQNKHRLRRGVQVLYPYWCGHRSER